MNLTFSTLATIIKYPFSSLTGNQDSKTELSKKKFGYFQSEEKDYLNIKEHFGLSKRYPFTFLLEAADDIAYSVADIEDACKKGIINEGKLLNILEAELNDTMVEEYPFVERFKNHIAGTDHQLKHRFDIAVQKFRIDVQGFMITAVINEFLENIESIIAGTYDKDLLENSKAKHLRKAFKEIAKEIFSHKMIIKHYHPIGLQKY